MKTEDIERVDAEITAPAARPPATSAPPHQLLYGLISEHEFAASLGKDVRSIARMRKLGIEPRSAA